MAVAIRPLICLPFVTMGGVVHPLIGRLPLTITTRCIVLRSVLFRMTGSTELDNFPRLSVIMVMGLALFVPTKATGLSLNFTSPNEAQGKTANPILQSFSRLQPLAANSFHITNSTNPPAPNILAEIRTMAFYALLSA